MAIGGIISGAAASGGRYIPADASLGHGPVRATYTILSYSANDQYSITLGTRSADTVTLSGSGTQVSTVTPSPPKGGVVGASKTFERRDYTYFYGVTGSNPGGGCDYLPGCGYICIYCASGNPNFGPFKSPTPSGFTDSYSEWWRVY
jgi:hypothetical protein